MLRTILSVAVPAVLLVALAACGEGAEDAEPAASAEPTSFHSDEPTNEALAGGWGTYALVPEAGGVIEATLQEDLPDDELVTRAESMREAAGVEAAHWVPVVVDNTDGSEAIWIDYGISVVTESGETFEAQSPTHLIEDWAATIGDPELTDDLTSAWLEANQEEILPGAKHTGYVLIDRELDGPPARVFFNSVQGHLAD